MPIYEYQCQECGAVSEKLLVGGESAADICCDNCGSSRVNKIISAAAFLKTGGDRHPGRTCCGQEERCDTPPCSSEGSCRRE